MERSHDASRQGRGRRVVRRSERQRSNRVTGRRYDGFVPGRHQIDAYGNGGFRFAEMSHRGSILALPSGIRAWTVTAPAEFSLEAFAPVFAESETLEILLVGTG